jgi:hypothetical protein
MPTYRLFGDLTGPTTASPTGSAGRVTSLLFEVTTGGCWLEGYWLWVCPTGQSTTPQTFTLWIPYPTTDSRPAGEVVAGTTVTSGQLMPGRWNFIPLPQAFPLAIATLYQLETAGVGGGPVTGNVWGAGESWAAGVSNGPLQAPPAGLNGQQQGATTTGTSPTAVMPVYGGYPANAYYWLDPQISTEAPPGSSYRLWPGMPLIVAPPKTTDSDEADTNEQSSGTEFWLSTACKLNKIWFWSPTANAAAGTPKAALLPSSCAIFDIATQSVVDGTLVGSTGPNPPAMPNWRKPDGTAAAAGDGWIYYSYEDSNITLPAGKYKAAVYSYGGGSVMDLAFYFFAEQRFYFGPAIDGTTGAVTGPATTPNGISNGPLSTPSVASAAPAESNGTVPVVPAGTVAPGNSTYQVNDTTNTGTFLYPDTFDTSDNGETRWIDAEVTPAEMPAGPASGPLLTSFP